MTNRRKVNYSQFDDFQAAIAKGEPTIGVAARGHAIYTSAKTALCTTAASSAGTRELRWRLYDGDVKREFLTAKAARELHHRLRTQDQLHRPLACSADQRGLPRQSWTGQHPDRRLKIRLQILPRRCITRVVV